MHKAQVVLQGLQQPLACTSRPHTPEELYSDLNGSGEVQPALSQVDCPGQEAEGSGQWAVRNCPQVSS